MERERESFSQINDTRHESYVEHKLVDVLILIMGAVVSGITEYATESGVTLGQATISHEDKTNEIPVFQSMLDCLDITRKTITADAMHCQKDTCAKIMKQGGNYIFGLKGNQSNLSENVRLSFENSINDEAIESFQTLEQNGGRVEKRVCRATANIEWLADLPLWAGLKTIFSVERTTTKP